MVKTRSSDWIGANCRNAESFAPLARRAMALPIGDVYYVDLANGTDSGDGDNWQKAFLTTAFALDQMTADRNDYMLLRGWKTESATSGPGSGAVIHRLDVAQTHMIGQAGMLNPYFPEKGSLYRSGAADAPILRFEQEFIEVAGFAVNAVQGSGTESSSVSKGFVEIGDYLDANAAGDGNKAYLHNCYFPDWNSGTTVTGLTITGAHYPTVHDCYFDSVYGNIDKGIYLCGSDDSNPGLGSFENLTFRGAMTAAVKWYGAGSCRNSTFNGITHPRGTYIFDFTADDTSAYNSFENISGNMAAGNIFNSASTVDARDTLISVMASIAGANVYGATVFPDT